MTLSLKENGGVRIAGVKSETVLGINIVASVFAKHDLDCVITSVMDGTHSEGSLHYVGLAADFRTRHIPELLLSTITLECKKALGPDFDFILEAANMPNQHYHMEFQPKVPY